jgi:hypothetical protein
MNSRQHLAQPPSIAVWLINLFAIGETAESILGDLLEEFSLLASSSGLRFARNWFWRQTLRTLPRLAGQSVRSAPWLTVVAIVGGFSLRKLIAPLIGRAIFAIVERYQAFFQHHFHAYLFFASTGIDIAHLLSFLLIGFVVALVARRNEMLATIALAAIYAAMAIFGSVYVAIKTSDGSLLWRLNWYFADSLGYVVAGAIVRTHRLTAAPRPTKPS